MPFHKRLFGRRESKETALAVVPDMESEGAKEKRPFKEYIYTAQKIGAAKRTFELEKERLRAAARMRGPGVRVRSYLGARRAIATERRMAALEEQAPMLERRRQESLRRIETMKVKRQLAEEQAGLAQARLKRQVFRRTAPGRLRVGGISSRGYRVVPVVREPGRGDPFGFGRLAAYGLGGLGPSRPMAYGPPPRRYGPPQAGGGVLQGSVLNILGGPAPRPQLAQGPVQGQPAEGLEFVRGHYRRPRPDKILAREIKERRAEIRAEMG